MTETDRSLTQLDRPSQTNAILLWVGITAGVVFIVAVVFFSGFVIGRSYGGGSLMNWDHGTHHPMGPWMMSPSTQSPQPSTPAVPTSPRP